MSFLPGVQKSILVVVVVVTGEGIKGMVQASPVPVRVAHCLEHLDQTYV